MDWSGLDTRLSWSAWHQLLLVRIARMDIRRRSTVSSGLSYVHEIPIQHCRRSGQISVDIQTTTFSCISSSHLELVLLPI
jgi:hypothetical protein